MLYRSSLPEVGGVGLALKKLSLAAMILTLVAGFAVIASALLFVFLSIPCAWCCISHPGTIDPNYASGLESPLPSDLALAAGCRPASLEREAPSPLVLATGWYDTGIPRDLAVGTVGLIVGILIVFLGILIYWREKLILACGIVAIVASLLLVIFVDGSYLVAVILALLAGNWSVASWVEHRPFTA